MWHHVRHSPSVPALVVIGIASWILIGAGYASLHRGYWAPAVVGTAVFITSVAVLCRAAVRSRPARRFPRATR